MNFTKEIKAAALDCLQAKGEEAYYEACARLADLQEEEQRADVDPYAVYAGAEYLGAYFAE